MCWEAPSHQPRLPRSLPPLLVLSGNGAAGIDASGGRVRMLRGRGGGEQDGMHQVGSGAL